MSESNKKSKTQELAEGATMIRPLAKVTPACIMGTLKGRSLTQNRQLLPVFISIYYQSREVIPV